MASFAIGLVSAPLTALVKARIKKEIVIRLNSIADKFMEINVQCSSISRVINELQEGKLSVHVGELINQLEALREEIHLERMRALKESLLYS